MFVVVGWLLIVIGRRWAEGGRWWTMVDGCWLVVGGLVVGGWWAGWLVGGWVSGSWWMGERDAGSEVVVGGWSLVGGWPLVVGGQ